MKMSPQFGFLEMISRNKSSKIESGNGVEPVACTLYLPPTC